MGPAGGARPKRRHGCRRGRHENPSPRKEPKVAPKCLDTSVETAGTSACATSPTHGFHAFRWAGAPAHGDRQECLRHVRQYETEFPKTGTKVATSPIKLRPSFVSA